jgi:ATP-dependent RNA helicase DHX36
MLCAMCMASQRRNMGAGVLLRRLAVDRSLSSVSHVVVDEIHERGVNEDILLIVLKEVLAVRPDLKVILMSATLNAEKFEAFCPGSKPIHIPGYTFPVDVRYMEDALKASQLQFPVPAEPVCFSSCTPYCSAV